MRPRRLFSLAATTVLGLAAAAAGDTTCVADLNNDGFTNVNDLLILLGDYNCAGTCIADINNDGFTNVNDLLIMLGDWNCVAQVGPQATLSGTVTNVWTGTGIAGATVHVGDETLVTDPFGDYSGDLAVGLYEITVEAENFFTSEPESLVLFPNIPAQLDVELLPVAEVIVDVVVLDEPAFDGTVDVAAVVTVLDGSTITGYAWTRTAGPDVSISGEDTDMATVTMGSRMEYKENLFEVLREPPIGPDQLPPNVPPPPGEFPGGQQDRFEVVGVNHFVLEEAGLVGLMVDVTTTSGVYSAESDLHTALPWKVSTGIRNVPIDAPVLLYGKTQASYDWAMTPPPGSTAALTDGTTQYPEFVPDVPGRYDLTVTDLNAAGAAPVLIEVWAGTWRGVIEGQDGDGNPVASSTCVNCHVNLGWDKFTPWAKTGHAEIFTQLLDTNTHYGPSCFGCHTVGYDPDADNNGIDEQFDWQDFLASGLLNNPGDNWTTMLADYPESAMMANAQCENCHGPQYAQPGASSGAHQSDARRSLSANVCGSCHGEPLRHGRFQQWQLSAHADYELAIDEGTNGSCARCHTANGFLAWLPILSGQVPGDPTANIPITWTADEVHPQTCVTCHDPHAAGDQSGDDNNATVRITGSTPPLIAGFTAYGVGRGAMCMTCHNSRNGLRNDSTFDDVYGTSEATRAPHGSPQADLLMGENAYNTLIGFRGNHSFLADTCAQCHMVQTPPPDDLSYQQGGTNHTFYASPDICAQCHTGFDAPTIQGGVQDTLDLLQAAIEQALLDSIGELTGQGYVIDLDGDAQITNATPVLDVEFGESRGRQAMTVTLISGTFGPYGMNSIDVLNNQMVLLGGFYDFADPNLIKAGWNFALVSNDGSLGVHNPSFAYFALGNAIAALNPSAAAAMQWPEWVEIPAGTQQ